MKKLLITMLFIAASVVSAVASDHTNLEENLPTELEDAYPIKFRSREVQGVIRYIDEDEGNRLVYQPVFEFGILPNTQLNVAATFYSGNVDRKGSGNVSSELLYNFNTESLWFPAAAIVVKGEFPTGEHSRGVDVTTKVILSKMPFVRTTLLHRVHVNLIWKHNSGRDIDERSDLFKGILGFSIRAGRDTSFILDYVREQGMEKHENSNIAEAGFRRQLTPFTVAMVGAGAGFGDDSERYRVTLGFQHSF
jgi:hypothetical protein